MNSNIERLRNEKAAYESAETAKAEQETVARKKHTAEIKGFAEEDVDGFLETAKYEDVLELEKKIHIYTVENTKLAFIYNGNIESMLRDMPGNGYLLNRYISHGLSLTDRDDFFSWISAVRKSFRDKWGEIKKTL